MPSPLDKFDPALLKKFNKHRFATNPEKQKKRLRTLAKLMATAEAQAAEAKSYAPIAPQQEPPKDPERVQAALTQLGQTT